ncbi:(2Fe-2S) ferredoxin domain-containing protein [Pedobacter sp. HMF7647]|uniref:(2Fe-2S) ferredoxin domain-containing protein n=1 Tax=Hufsiella arboris TaxID=2695275 RepID=A0A7K1YA44_9SPHI|nr:(2Fe-2S) ferredoxin domain-containing protein [Hufsiella arboris]MXV50938.1 (2Fe-2S) ferredoxin domain-containing protein [Hufsiella arboris]
MSKFHIPEKVVYVCVGSKCSKRGGKDFYKLFKSYKKRYGLKDEVEVIKVDCTDRCKFAPVLAIQPDNIWLKEYSEKEALNLVERLLIEKKEV